MKVLIFGGSGGLGSKITEKFEEDEVYSLSSKDCDIVIDNQEGNNTIENLIRDTEPDVIINMVVRNRDGLLHKQGLIDITTQIDATIFGTLNILRYAIPYFREKNKGKIILCSSYLADNPVAGTGIYSGCKAFTDSIVKTVALENVKYNITCNSIRMGYFDGGLTYKIPEKFFNTLKESIPMKRFGTIDELYSVMNFLINNDYVTGTNLVIDGGMSLV